MSLENLNFGPLTIPLIACSVVGLAIIIDRVITLAISSLYRVRADGSVIMVAGKSITRITQRGLCLIDQYRDQPKVLRDEMLSLWLHRQHRKLSSGIKLLQIIGTLAPLFGLLGTVLGLIKVFGDLGDHQGTIEPALIAEGLGMAMNTTAAGLVIALPALAMAYGLQMWVDRILASAEHTLNFASLKFSGLGETLEELAA